MVLFAIAHAVRLTDGSFALRAAELPGCAVRNTRIDIAREEFAQALGQRVAEMLEAGERPPLYSFEELETCFAQRCRQQVPATDRAAGSFDTVMAIRPKLLGGEPQRPRASQGSPEAPANVAESPAGGDPQPIAQPGSEGVALEASVDQQPTVLSEIEEIIDSCSLHSEPQPENQHRPDRSTAAAVTSSAAIAPEPAGAKAAAAAGEPVPPTARQQPPASQATTAARLGALWRAGVNLEPRQHPTRG